MKDKNRHISDPDLNEIWEKTGHLERDSVVTPEETERALGRINRRIGPDKGRANNPSSREAIWLRTRYLIAAIALIVFAAAWLFTPKTVSVPYGEFSTVNLPDGSTVQLNSGSTLTYHRIFTFSGREVSLNGEGYFEVQPGDSPFRVEANGTTTEVLGTTFNIRSWSSDPDRKTVISVTSGLIEFFPSSLSDNRVQLKPGTASSWAPGLETPADPDPVSINDITGWLDNRMVFRDQPLQVVFNEIERRYNIEIDVEVESAASETITAFYNEPRTAEAILKDIGMVKGYRLSETSTGFRIFK